ncbi:N-formylglutamate amidohydrolase [Oceanicella actignis]|uniref:Predicted N-formylglutamate amidohydrolase n=1 Tax=Oceanicella actignis TaxID=1189325 RepID=A0A1M7SNT3_9RHOB|nr:N-formylglutamate amidohydrolase [Oceanicella actignis]SES64700.1 Predicted N-formylglutamate amidohydrolase [Oceanicella actignis]SHN60074.1 Predicted N-formylglutamate amidohydrolase [Oceanicella actignis]
MPTDPAFEIANPDGRPDVLLLCDHASNRVPPEVCGGDLGLPPEDMARHIAYDVGARGVTLELARLLDAPAVLSTFSRLVIDPNRGEDDPTLIMKLYDGSVIPGNRHVDGTETARRLSDWHRPYHDAIRARIARAEAVGARPALISIHSFTPQLRGRAPRPWHVGVLWDRDSRLAAPLLELLRAEPDLCVGDNEPYSGQLQGDCMWTHGTRRGLPHALIEIRNDLIADPEGERAWARRLAPILRRALDRAAAPA